MLAPIRRNVSRNFQYCVKNTNALFVNTNMSYFFIYLPVRYICLVGKGLNTSNNGIYVGEIYHSIMNDGRTSFKGYV